MSWKVTLTITVTNPDTNQQFQAKDSVLSFDPEATPQRIMERALDFLKEEIDHPRLPLEEDPDADATSLPRDADMTDEEWEASLAEASEPEPANA